MVGLVAGLVELPVLLLLHSVAIYLEICSRFCIELTCFASIVSGLVLRRRGTVSVGTPFFNFFLNTLSMLLQY